jgi:hypothetical protein
METILPTVTTLQMLGVAGVLSYAAARFAAKAGVLGYNRYMLVSVPVAGMPAMPRGFRVEEMTAAQLSAHDIDVSPEVQQARFAQGLTCLAAFNPKGQLVGVNLLKTRAAAAANPAACPNKSISTLSMAPPIFSAPITGCRR